MFKLKFTLHKGQGYIMAPSVVTTPRATQATGHIYVSLIASVGGSPGKSWAHRKKQNSKLREEQGKKLTSETMPAKYQDLRVRTNQFQTGLCSWRSQPGIM